VSWQAMGLSENDPFARPICGLRTTLHGCNADAKSQPIEYVPVFFLRAA
jgi:hypothetical protein